MADSSFPKEERLLAEQLKREAEALRPEFSEVLHRKVCQAVEQTALQISRRRPASAVSRWTAYLAVAVALLVSAVPVVWQALDAPGPGQQLARIAVTNPPPAPDVPQAIEHLSALAAFSGGAPTRVDETVESKLVAGQWAQLGHDVRLAASLLTDPLPLEMMTSSNPL